MSEKSGKHDSMYGRLGKKIRLEKAQRHGKSLRRGVAVLALIAATCVLGLAPLSGK